MPLFLVRNDITKMKVDAIVNAAKSSLLGGGGVDGAIHRAAGKGLLEECKTLGGCETGDAKITGGYNLPAKFVIHAVGPVWWGGKLHEREKLASCYRESLRLAKEFNCESIAFPLISAGNYGYPKKEALEVAMDEINHFLKDNDMVVYITIFDRESLYISEQLFSDIEKYIDDQYVDNLSKYDQRNPVGDYRCYQSIEKDEINESVICVSPPLKEGLMYADTLNYKENESQLLSQETCYHSLEDAFKHMGESFSQMLLRKIDEKHITDVDCYKKANVDRKLFSKIRNNPNYKPSKSTAVAFAIALELSLNEVKEFLASAGYALSHSSKFDIIIEYFIVHGNYDVNEINLALFEYDQNVLGNVIL